MDVRLFRNRIKLIPEESNANIYELEVGLIEDGLGLTKDGDWVKLVRRNAAGRSILAYLETEKREGEKCQK